MFIKRHEKHCPCLSAIGGAFASVKAMGIGGEIDKGKKQYSRHKR